MSEPDFAFEKQLAIHELYSINMHATLMGISKLIEHIYETNKKEGVFCDSFRLEYRPQTREEEIQRRFPRGSKVFDLKWGSKQELEEKKEKQ